MMGGGVQGTPQIQPIMIDGEEHYVLCMNPWDEYNLRTNTAPASGSTSRRRWPPRAAGQEARSSRAAGRCTTTWCCTSHKA
jgi:hypothetical protein